MLPARGEALDILKWISAEELQDFWGYILHLEKRFRDKHLQQVYQAQLKNRYQKKHHLWPTLLIQQLRQSF